MQQDSRYSAQKQSRIPNDPPVVKSVEKGVPRPLWSVMIPVYNCYGYLRLALRTLLSQDPGGEIMQIAVIDDCSTDGDVAALVLEMGEGRVEYFRQAENVGSLRNFQTCLELSRGRLVHLLHGDDLVRKGFYDKMEQLFCNYPTIGAAFCRYAYIDETGRFLYHHEREMDCDGIPHNWLRRLAERQRIQYCAMVVKREVYEQLGGFYGVEYGEDWEMWVRIAAHFDVAYTPEVLADYRRHYSSISGRTFVTARNMACLEWVMGKIQHHLRSAGKESVIGASRSFYAHYALRVANALWKRFKDKRGASAQALAAWNMSRDAGLLYKIIKLYTRITLNI